MAFMIRRNPATPRAARLYSEFVLQIALIRLAHVFREKPAKVVVDRKCREVPRHLVNALQHVCGPLAYNRTHDDRRQRHAATTAQFEKRSYGISRGFESSFATNLVVRLLVAVDRQQEDQVSYACKLVQVRLEQGAVGR